MIEDNEKIDNEQPKEIKENIPSTKVSPPNPSIVLVRSSRELINLNQIGYGWWIDFSKHHTADDLLETGFSGRDIGKKSNQIKRFFNLTKGDLVVVPVGGAIAIAKVEGKKTYVNPSSIKFAENRIDVTYLSDKNGNVFIPRKSLSTALETRLKIRMAIASLSEFSEEIKKLVIALDNGELHTIKKEVIEKKEIEKEKFTKELLSRLKKGTKINIQAGGYGLEKLVTELLRIEGYKASIQAKNQSSGIADIDIKATKRSITGKEENLLIQVKHHDGTTGIHAIQQLKTSTEIGEKVLITTAELDETASQEAEKEGIIVINGEELVNWIYDSIEQLSSNTREQLGILIIPVLI